MSFALLRRLAITCHSTSSSIYYRRTFATSSSLFNQTNTSTTSTTDSNDSPRTITLIP
ncbi:unnamed protein product, partial [Rotaria sordida]